MDDDPAGRLKLMIQRAQERGFVTYGEQIEDITAMLQGKGIALVEFPEDYDARDPEPIDRETACRRSIGRTETALAVLRHGRIRFALQLLDATAADLRPFVEN